MTVRHDPTVLSVGTFLSGDPDWIDSWRLLDFDQGTTGLASNSQDAVTIDVSAVDLDDSASVRLFFDETTDRWIVEAGDGARTTASICVVATGCLSSPSLP